MEHALHPEHTRVHHWIKGTCGLPRLEGRDFSICEDDFCQREHGASGTQMGDRVAGMIPSTIVAVPAE